MADITLTITIPDAKAAKAKEGFLRECPKPAAFGGTDKEWIEEVLRRTINQHVRRGLHTIAQEATTIEDDYTE